MHLHVLDTAERKEAVLVKRFDTVVWQISASIQKEKRLFEVTGSNPVYLQYFQFVQSGECVVGNMADEIVR